MIKKTKVLWISMFAPISTASSGGSQTFNYYFKQFLQDDRFEIRLVSCGVYSEREIVEKETEEIVHHIVYWGSKNQSLFEKVKNIESKFNLLNKNAGLVSNSDKNEIIATIKKYKSDGYEPDVTILEWTNMVMLAKQIKNIYPKTKIVASEHDVTFIGYRRKYEYFTGTKKLLWKLKYMYEKRMELSNLSKCDLVLPHNKDNKAVLMREGILESKIIGLVPYFKNMTLVPRNSNYKDILFFGAMARPENSLSAIWFIENVLPRLTDLDIRFVILGSNPPGELKKYQSDRVYITGFVDSITPYFSQSMCLVAPLVLGAGIKIKVLEALSSGIPVLTNEIGIEGIPAKNEQEYFQCTKPEEYEAMIRCIYNKKFDEKYIENKAKEFIRENFSVDGFSSYYRNEIYRLGGKN
ncbi:glycosyltransferase [Clostridium fessum]|uniref:glycosyltransferase n=1 Tax=Clostridium fessum TaxID=2126740 RepID=UPI00265CE6F4|nr:glycosyltransferase [Clostridium fessum]